MFRRERRVRDRRAEHSELGAEYDAAALWHVGPPAHDDAGGRSELKVRAADQREGLVGHELRHEDQVTGRKRRVPDADGKDVLAHLQRRNSGGGDVLKRCVVWVETVARLVHGRHCVPGRRSGGHFRRAEDLDPVDPHHAAVVVVRTKRQVLDERQIRDVENRPGEDGQGAAGDARLDQILRAGAVLVAHTVGACRPGRVVESACPAQSDTRIGRVGQILHGGAALDENLLQGRRGSERQYQNGGRQDTVCCRARFPQTFVRKQPTPPPAFFRAPGGERRRLLLRFSGALNIRKSRGCG